FNHHPFYEKVPLEIPDNWDNERLYNVPLEDMMNIIDNALLNGYTIAWDGDLTKGSFNHTRGIAINPLPEDFEEAVKLEKVFPELVVTQELRQKDFETFKTVDDHLMHLTGIVKDQDGTYFYKTKNSWGTGRNEEMAGYLYMSKSYIEMRTISILVHKDAIPKEIKNKLGIK
ncbi:MAG: C1 family peptidase, partial [Bacteroidales bacterium]